MKDYYSKLNSDGLNPNGFAEKFKLPDEIHKSLQADPYY